MLQTGGAEPSPAQPSQATPAATRGSPPAQPSPAHRPPPPQHTRYLDTGHLDTRCGVRTGDAAPRPANCCSLLAAAVGGAGRGCAAGGCSRRGVGGVPPPGVRRRGGVTRVCGLGPPSYVQRPGGQNTPGTSTATQAVTPQHIHIKLMQMEASQLYITFDRNARH